MFWLLPPISPFPNHFSNGFETKRIPDRVVNQSFETNSIEETFPAGCAQQGNKLNRISNCCLPPSPEKTIFERETASFLHPVDTHENGESKAETKKGTVPVPEKAGITAYNSAFYCRFR